MDITEQLSRLSELSDQELAELEKNLRSEFKSAEKQELTASSVERLETLADAIDSTRSELTNRESQRSDFAAKAEAAAARVNGDGEPDPVADEKMPDDKTMPADETLPEDKKKEVFAAETTEPAKVEEPAKTAELAVEEPIKAEEPVKAAELAVAVVTEDKVEAKVEDKVEDKPAETPAPNAEAAQPDNQPDPTQAPAPPAEVDIPAVNETSTEVSSERPAEASNTDNNESEAAVTAAAQGTGDSLVVEPPANRLPKERHFSTLAITAGADIPGVSAGTTLTDMDAVADAFQKRLHTLRHVNGGDGEQHIVATLQSQYPESRMLSHGDLEGNAAKIEAVASQEAITAAAGVCLPLETRYDLGCEVGVTDRPVRDALARFAADRGGVRFFSAPSISALDAGIGFWERTSDGTFRTLNSDHTTVTTPPLAKPCVEIQCTAATDAYIEAVTLCLTINNLSARTFPELIKRNNDLALVQHARVAERNLLTKIKAGSTAVSAVNTSDVGMVRQFLRRLDILTAKYRHKNRLGMARVLRMIAPEYLKEFLKADLAMQMPGDGMEATFGITDAVLESWFRARNINITWHHDAVSADMIDLSNFTIPTTVEFSIFAEGTWLFLDGGTLDLGVIRDSGLVAANAYKQFVETFEGTANVGCDSLWVTLDVCLSGAAAALVDTGCRQNPNTTDKATANPGDVFAEEPTITAEDAANAAKLTTLGFTAVPATAWTTGQYMTVGIYRFSWTGTAWAAGPRP